MSRGGGWHTGYVESEWYLQSVMLRRRPPRARFQPLPLTVKRCYIHPGILLARFFRFCYIFGPVCSQDYSIFDEKNLRVSLETVLNSPKNITLFVLEVDKQRDLICWLKKFASLHSLQ